MQNIEQKLKELKNISPDPGYTRRSRSLIVEAPITQKPLSPWRFVVASFQSGSAIVLTAVLLLIIIGGFSAWKLISPFRLDSLDPASLRAEAEAVDIQIELTNLAYPEADRSAAAQVQTAPTTTAAPPPLTEATSTEEEEKEEEKVDKVSVDQALDILAE